MKKWYPVRVYFPATPWSEAEVYEDEIRGTSPLDALRNAAWNWPAAERVELK